MRKMLLVSMVLLVAAQAFAGTVTMSVVNKGQGWASIGYSADANVSGFGLKIYTADPNASAIFTDINDYNRGECNSTKQGYGIFPGSIVIDSDGNVSDYNTPIAPNWDPCAAGTGLQTSTVIAELGALYSGEANKPPRSGTLLSLKTNGDCNVCVTGEPLRGSVVLQDATQATWDHNVVCARIVTLAPPGAPSNVSPGNTATCISTTASINWTPGTGATAQDVCFGTASPPPLLTTIGDGTTATYSPAMNSNTTYYWCIVAKNGAGSTAGPIWSFTTKPAIVSPASSPTPTSGATCQSLTQTLSWTGDPNAATYDVYFGKDNPPATKVSSNQAGTTYNPGTMDSNSKYYWYINEKTTCSDVCTGTVWNFTTKPVLVSAASSPSPVAGANSVSLSPTLSWTADNNAATYDVYLDGNNPPTTKVSSNQTGKTYPASGLSVYTLYYWKIVEKTSCGDTNTGAVWCFGTGPQAGFANCWNEAHNCLGDVNTTSPYYMPGGDNFVRATDVTAMLAFIANLGGSHRCPTSVGSKTCPPCYDVTGDGFVRATDVTALLARIATFGGSHRHSCPYPSCANP